MISNPTPLPSRFASSRSASLKSASLSQKRNDFHSIVLHQLSCLSRNIIRFLAQGNEPRISQKNHLDGRISWTIYHPGSSQRITCSSETEVRFWLEQQYNLR